VPTPLPSGGRAKRSEAEVEWDDVPNLLDRLGYPLAFVSPKKPLRSLKAKGARGRDREADFVAWLCPRAEAQPCDAAFVFETKATDARGGLVGAARQAAGYAEAAEVETDLRVVYDGVTVRVHRYGTVEQPLFEASAAALQYGTPKLKELRDLIGRDALIAERGKRAYADALERFRRAVRRPDLRWEGSPPGREALVGDIVARLARPGSREVVSGPLGMGKSAILQAVAARTECVFCDLAQVSRVDRFRPGDVMLALAVAVADRYSPAHLSEARRALERGGGEFRLLVETLGDVGAKDSSGALIAIDGLDEAPEDLQAGVSQLMTQSGATTRWLIGSRLAPADVTGAHVVQVPRLTPEVAREVWELAGSPGTPYATAGRLPRVPLMLELLRRTPPRSEAELERLLGDGPADLYGAWWGGLDSDSQRACLYAATAPGLTTASEAAEVAFPGRPYVRDPIPLPIRSMAAVADLTAPWLAWVHESARDFVLSHYPEAAQAEARRDWTAYRKRQAEGGSARPTDLFEALSAELGPDRARDEVEAWLGAPPGVANDRRLGALIASLEQRGDPLLEPVAWRVLLALSEEPDGGRARRSLARWARSTQAAWSSVVERARSALGHADPSAARLIVGLLQELVPGDATADAALKRISQSGRPDVRWARLCEMFGSRAVASAMRQRIAADGDGTAPSPRATAYLATWAGPALAGPVVDAVVRAEGDLRLTALAALHRAVQRQCVDREAAGAAILPPSQIPREAAAAVLIAAETGRSDVLNEVVEQADATPGLMLAILGALSRSAVPSAADAVASPTAGLLRLLGTAGGYLDSMGEDPRTDRLLHTWLEVALAAVAPDADQRMSAWLRRHPGAFRGSLAEHLKALLATGSAVASAVLELAGLREAEPQDRMFAFSALTRAEPAVAFEPWCRSAVDDPELRNYVGGPFGAPLRIAPVLADRATRLASDLQAPAYQRNLAGWLLSRQGEAATHDSELADALRERRLWGTISHENSPLGLDLAYLSLAVGHTAADVPHMESIAADGHHVARGVASVALARSGVRPAAWAAEQLRRWRPASGDGREERERCIANLWLSHPDDAESLVLAVLKRLRPGLGFAFSPVASVLCARSSQASERVRRPLLAALRAWPHSTFSMGSMVNVAETFPLSEVFPTRPHFEGWFAASQANLVEVLAHRLKAADSATAQEWLHDVVIHGLPVAAWAAERALWDQSADGFASWVAQLRESSDAVMRIAAARASRWLLGGRPADDDTPGRWDADWRVRKALLLAGEETREMEWARHHDRRLGERLEGGVRSVWAYGRALESVGDGTSVDVLDSLAEGTVDEAYGAPDASRNWHYVSLYDWLVRTRALTLKAWRARLESRWGPFPDKVTLD